MSIARSTATARVGFVGSDESTLISTLASGSTNAGSEIDVLGNDTSDGYVKFFLYYSSTVATGSIDIRVSSNRVTGQSYTARSFQFSVPAVIGTAQKVELGILSASRYMHVDVLNNALGAALTNFAVLGELKQVS